ncbi:MAG: hypothetical protein Kow0089_19550 [Desulfobulbaceae bacterium]
MSGERRSIEAGGALNTSGKDALSTRGSTDLFELVERLGGSGMRSNRPQAAYFFSSLFPVI